MMKFDTVLKSMALSTAIACLSAGAAQAQQAETINLVCGRDDDQDAYYLEVTLSESDAAATFVRRSHGRTIGPYRLPAIFTPTEVRFEKGGEGSRASQMTKEVFVISRVDLTMTRWLEASFSDLEPRKSVEQCELAPMPAVRAF